MAVAAVLRDRAVSELASAFGVHPVEIAQWKKRAVTAAAESFGTRRGTADADQETTDRRAAVGATYPEPSGTRQCALLEVSRLAFLMPDRALSTYIVCSSNSS